jgi:hypothetical protein
MPNNSRRKGDRAERQIVELLRAFGFDAFRVPLSGAASGFKSDIEVRLGARTLRLESKVRAHKFGMIYRWLFGSDAVVVKSDHKPALVILTLENFASLLRDNANQTQIATSNPSQ